jgi:hypothetical protein
MQSGARQADRFRSGSAEEQDRIAGLRACGLAAYDFNREELAEHVQ